MGAVTSFEISTRTNVHCCFRYAKVIPNKLQALDFKFKYPDLKIALEDLVH